MNNRIITYRNSLLGICILLLAGACSDEKKDPAIDKLPFSIHPVADNNFSTSNSSESSAFKNNDAMGLFVTNSRIEHSPSDNIYNTKYIYNGSEWKAQGGYLWPEGEIGMDCKLVAYTPHAEIQSFQKHSFSVNTDQSTADKMSASDFLYTQSAVKKQNEAVTLNMSHLFSEITVHITYSEGMKDRCSEILFIAQKEAIINLQKGTCYSQGSSSKITPVRWTKATEENSENYSAIIPPQSITNLGFVSLILNGKKEIVNIEEVFKSGQNYTIELTALTQGGIVLKSIQETPWEKLINIEEGTVSKVDYYSTGSVITYQKKRDVNPVTMIIMGDGFTREQLLKNGLFEKKAAEAIEYLFTTEPFKSYREYFNIYFIAAESQQSGADNPDKGIMKNTYFDTGWSDDYHDMKANNDKVFNFANQYCPDIVNRKTTILKVPIFLLVNDERYGGICWTWSDGKSFAICPLTKGILNWTGKEPNITGVSSGDWKNTFIHECGGHCFSKLDDEYWYDDNATNTEGKTLNQHRWEVPFGKNVTADISQSSASNYWKHMTNNSRFPKVGYFEGGHYCGKGIWRSERISCMIDNRRYYNAYSRQLIVERILSIANEPFNYDSFLAKDVNYDEILDNRHSPSHRSNVDISSLKISPPLPRPILIEVE